jgi:alkylation response protein AidB-like acyl-CoA dehydrogenase
MHGNVARRAWLIGQSGPIPFRLNTGVRTTGGSVLDLNDTPELAEYREGIRAWLQEHRSQAPVIRGEGAIEDERELVAARRAWQRTLAEGGLAAVTWPAEYGGRGLGPLHQVVVNQEIGRARVPGIFDFIGVGMLAPTIIAHGTEAQKQRYLGPMLVADEVWCQLFSEPAAGSDLAGIQTRAPAPRTDRGDCPGRRCGRRTPSTPRSGSCWHGPTPTCRSTRA